MRFEKQSRIGEAREIAAQVWSEPSPGGLDLQQSLTRSQSGLGVTATTSAQPG